MRFELAGFTFPVLHNLEECCPALNLTFAKAMVWNRLCYRKPSTKQFRNQLVEINEKTAKIIMGLSYDSEEDFVRGYEISIPEEVILICSLQLRDSNNEEPEDWALRMCKSESHAHFNMSKSLNSAIADIFNLCNDNFVWLQLQPLISYDCYDIYVEDDPLLELIVGELKTDHINDEFAQNNFITTCFPFLTDQFDIVENASLDCLFIELLDDEMEIPTEITLTIIEDDGWTEKSETFWPSERGFLISTLNRRIIVVAAGEKTLNSKKEARHFIRSILERKPEQDDLNSFYKITTTGISKEQSNLYLFNWLWNWF